MATGMGDANNTGRLSRDRDGRPTQQQAANNDQHRFHVLNIHQWLKRSSTSFGFFLSIFGVVADTRMIPQLMCRARTTTWAAA